MAVTWLASTDKSDPSHWVKVMVCIMRLNQHLEGRLYCLTQKWPF